MIFNEATKELTIYFRFRPRKKEPEDKLPRLPWFRRYSLTLALQSLQALHLELPSLVH